MLKQLSLENFKALENIELDFAKLNLIIGPNASGKSSIIQALALMKQTIIHNDEGKSGVSYELEPPDHYFSLGAFSSVVFGHDESRKIRIALEFELSDDEKHSLNKFFEPFPDVALARLGFEVKFDISFHLQGITVDGKYLLLVERENEDLVTARSMVYPTLSEQIYRQSLNRMIFLWEDHPDWMNIPYGHIRDASRRAALFLKRIIMLFYPLPALRGLPKRSYPLSDSPPEVTGGSTEILGHKTANRLMHMMGSPEQDRVLDEIKRWCGRFSLNVTCHLSEDAKEVIVEIGDLIAEKTGTWVNVLDAGFGGNQLLPVIVQGEIAPPGSLLMVEEPEIHLHPWLQAELIDFFIELVQEGKQVLATTHSEHLLFRLQRRIAEGKIKAEDVAVYYFNRKDGKIEIRKVEIDERGFFEEGLPGFFEADVQELSSFLEAMAKGK